MGRAELWRAESFPIFWAGVAGPWLEEQVRAVPGDARPAVVLVPSRSAGYSLKDRWMESGAGGVGVRFWTPGDLREFLRAARFPGKDLAGREALHLLLSLAAESAGGDGLAAAIASDPAGLMRSVDDLSAAGWPWEALGGGVVGRVLVEFRRLLEESGLWTAQACDWALAQAAPEAGEAPIRALLVHGFTGANWPLWPLLLAGARSAESLVVTLAYPRREAERLDQVWASSWEEYLGQAAQELGEADEAGPFRRLAERLEAGDLRPDGASPARDAGGAAGPVVEIGGDAAAEAAAIAGRVLEWLAKGGSGRVAVVFPEAGVLSREVGKVLDRAEIPHNDALGFPSAQPPDEAAWREWLGLQAEWTAGRLDRLVSRRPESLWPPHGGGRLLRDRLKRAIQETMDDDMDVLRAALAASGHARDLEAFEMLGALERLPDAGAFGALAGAAASALDRLGWTWRAASVRLRARGLSERVQRVVRRRHFVEWLRAALESGSRERGAAGREPYARVQLLLARDAEPQAWSRVILAGMNEGAWPRVPGADAFLPESTRAALNGRALEQGRQGEGHRVVAPGRGMILGDAEWRYIGLRQCFNLIEGAREGLCLTAHRRREDDAARLFGPADLLVKAHFAATGAMLTDEALARLAEATAARWAPLREWLAAGRGDDAEWRGAGPGEVRAAWEARRRRGDPFGPYDFCLRPGTTRAVRLACKDWESAWRFPAPTWLKQVAGVAPIERLGESDQAALALGIWAHAWVARALNPERLRELVPAPEPDAAMRGIDEAALAARARAEAAFASSGRTLPAWWEAVWRRAAWAARAMCAEALDGGATHLGTEWTLPEDCEVALGDVAPLRMRGRIDLIRAAAPRFGGPMTVIDFKTGGDVKLTASEIKKGLGLQIVLYGQALRALGAGEVWLRIVRPEGGGGAGRKLEDAAVPEILLELARMQATGAFGVRGEMVREFGYSPDLPLATLPVDPDINDERWARSHGGAGEAGP